MTMEQEEKGTTSPGTVEADSTESTQDCGPGCCCGAPGGKGHRTLKIAVCIAVIAAVAAILFYKTTSARPKAGSGLCCPASGGNCETSNPAPRK
ncbi:MAG TPA: hypothetical protein VGK27_01535 [Candidatus Deferrimicrobiaceae bacterium]|jgi:hypothetical protein